LLFAIGLVVVMLYGALAGREPSADWASRPVLRPGPVLHPGLYDRLTQIDDDTEVDVLIFPVGPYPAREGNARLERLAAATMVALRPEATQFVRTDGRGPNASAITTLPTGPELQAMRGRLIRDQARRDALAIYHALYEELFQMGKPIRSARDAGGISTTLTKREIATLSQRRDIALIEAATTPMPAVVPVPTR
jgi:hypothetical protein